MRRNKSSVEPIYKPEFKPGNKPYLKFGNEILNDNLPWADILNEVLTKSGLNLSQIAGKLNTSINNLNNIVNGNACPLTLKQGAILLSLQNKYY